MTLFQRDANEEIYKKDARELLEQDSLLTNIRNLVSTKTRDTEHGHNCFSPQIILWNRRSFSSHAHSKLGRVRD